MSVDELVSAVRTGNLGVTRRGPARHRNMSAVIGWSINLLDPPDAEGLASLATFAGTFEAAAADAVSGADGLAHRLARRSLLARDVDVAGHARFRLLETVRTQLPAVTEADRSAHLAYHLTFAALAEAGVRGGDSSAWMQRVRASSEDLRRAVRTAFEQAAPDAARLVAALYWPWFLEGRLAELQSWAEVALDPPPPDDRLIARLYWALAAARIAQGDLDGADRAAELMVRQAKAAGDHELTGLGHSVRGMVGWARGDHQAAHRQHALALAELENGPAWSAALVSALAGRSATGADAARLLETAAALAERAGEPMVRSSVLDYRGSTALAAGDIPLAADLAEQALAGYSAVGYQEGVASARALAGTVSAMQGRWKPAEDHFAAALDLCRKLHHPGGIATALDGLGIVAAHTGQPELAATRLQQAAAERLSIGAGVAPNLMQLREAALAAIGAR
jgi:tetratricopeptide (TPR) repeat protein